MARPGQLGSHKSASNSVKQKKVYLFDPENGETTRELAAILIDRFKETITFKNVPKPKQDDLSLAIPLAIIVRSTTPRFQDDFDEALEKTKGTEFNDPDILIYLHKDYCLESDATERCANLDAKYRDIKIIDMGFSKSKKCWTKNFILYTMEPTSRPSRKRLENIVNSLYEKKEQAMKVCLYDPENGEATRQIVRHLFKKFRDDITFQNVATSAENISCPLAVLVKGTARRDKDDLDEALKKTKDAGFNDPDIVIYLHKDDCLDSDGKLDKNTNYMEYLPNCTFYSKEQVSISSRNDLVHVVKCLYQRMKTLYVYTKREPKVSNAIIKELQGFTKGELQIEICDSLKCGIPLAVICHEDALCPGVAGNLSDEIEELETTVNLVVLRLLQNEVNGYWKVEKATKPFEIIDIDISDNKEGKCFITHKICTFLIGFVEKCKLESPV